MSLALALVLGVIAVAVPLARVDASTPDPGRSRIGWSSAPHACGYVFRSAPGGDRLTVYVTVRDAFDIAVQNCRTSVTVQPNAGTQAFCSCCPTRFEEFTDTSGAMAAVFGRAIGGRGSLDVTVTSHCIGDIGIATFPIEFTSSDLTATCTTPGIFSLGAWAAGLPPGYQVSSDYTCDGIVNVFDLAVWSSDLGVACSCPGP